MSCWAGLISMRWQKVPTGPAKVPTVMRSSWGRSSGQVAPQAFSAMGQQEGGPAENDVGADLLFFPVVDGAEG